MSLSLLYISNHNYDHLCVSQMGSNLRIREMQLEINEFGEVIIAVVFKNIL